MYLVHVRVHSGRYELLCNYWLIWGGWWRVLLSLTNFDIYIYMYNWDFKGAVSHNVCTVCTVHSWVSYHIIRSSLEMRDLLTILYSDDGNFYQMCMYHTYDMMIAAQCLHILLFNSCWGNLGQICKRYTIFNGRAFKLIIITRGRWCVGNQSTTHMAGLAPWPVAVSDEITSFINYRSCTTYPCAHHNWSARFFTSLFVYF